MTSSTEALAAVIAALRTDPAILTMLGDTQQRVRHGHLKQHGLVPGIYVAADVPSSAPYAIGHRSTGIRRADDSVAADCWVASGPEDAKALADAAESALARAPSDPVWIPPAFSAGDALQDPDHQEWWHVVLRFAVVYHKRDEV